MTDDLRARIAEALEECRTLIPVAQADAVLAIVQPELWRLASLLRERAPCTRCGHPRRVHDYNAAIRRAYCSACSTRDLHTFQPEEDTPS